VVWSACVLHTNQMHAKNCISYARKNSFSRINYTTSVIETHLRENRLEANYLVNMWDCEKHQQSCVHSDSYSITLDCRAYELLVSSRNLLSLTGCCFGPHLQKVDLCSCCIWQQLLCCRKLSTLIDNEWYPIIFVEPYKVIHDVPVNWLIL